MATIEVPDEYYEAIDEFVEDSTVFETPSEMVQEWVHQQIGSP